MALRRTVAPENVVACTTRQIVSKCSISDGSIVCASRLAWHRRHVRVGLQHVSGPGGLMPDETTAPEPFETDELLYESGGLPKTTNWWGAFVIGLAGTILVTGIAPVMVTELGAASVPVIVFITLTGYIVCLLLAELSAMMPDRSGGLPSSAYPAYKERWPRFAEHVNGFTAWAYWLGWFPVAPLNMILASFYLVGRFHLSTAGFTPIHTPIAYWTVAISVVGLILLFIPAYMGLRFGTVFATTLAILSMIPLTFIAIAWIFNPSVAHFSNLSGFHQLSGGSFFSS